MHRRARPLSALLALLASAALSGLVAANAGATEPDGIVLRGSVTTDAAGDALLYTFTVTNAGDSTLSDVTLDPAAFTGTGAPPALSCPQSLLPADVTESCTASYGLTATDMAADEISYTATIAGTDDAGAAMTGPSSTAVFRVKHPTFIDSPDITNDDIGDLNKLPGGAAVIQSYGNSWNQAAENSVDWTYNTIASYQPSSFLISGDLVEGRWGEPGDTSGLFGPNPKTRIQNMATFYQGENVQRLQNAGLLDKLYAIPGDHDYGDNWWKVTDPTGYGKIKYDNFDIWRNSFYENYDTNPDGSPRFSDRPVGTQWDKTAYATMLSPDMLLVSVDVFNRLSHPDDAGNGVKLGIVDGQLAWLKRVLAAARAPGSTVKWIVVQGHVPVITPVRVSHSSGLHLGGRTTDFWQTMKQYKVNLYLAGEVHATSRRSLNGITQITTGSPLEYTGSTTFVAVHEYADHLGLVDWGWNVPENAPNPPSWDGACGVPEIEANSKACPPGRVVSMNYDYSGYEPTVQGTLDIGADNTADDGTGNLIEYVNPPAPTPPAPHPAIALTNAVSPTSSSVAGDHVTYSFTLTNNGNLPLTHVKLAQAAFSGQGVHPVVTCPQDALPVAVSETCRAGYTVTGTDLTGPAITETVTASAVAPSGSRVFSKDKTSTVAMPPDPAVHLSVGASVRSIGKAGAKVVYTYRLSNTGNVAVTAVKASRTAHTGAGTWSTISCPRTTLAFGAEMACTATYTATQADVEAAKPITSTAVAAGKGPDGHVISSNASKTSAAVTQRPSLSLTDKPNVTSVGKAGQRIGYNLVVKNNGNLKMHALTVHAVFSGGSGTRSRTVHLTKVLAPAATTRLKVVYTVTRADIRAGKPIVSTATVSGKSFSTVAAATTSNKPRVRVAVR